MILLFMMVNESGITSLYTYSVGYIPYGRADQGTMWHTLYRPSEKAGFEELPEIDFIKALMAAHGRYRGVWGLTKRFPQNNQSSPRPHPFSRFARRAPQRCVCYPKFGATWMLTICRILSHFTEYLIAADSLFSSFFFTTTCGNNLLVEKLRLRNSFF